MSYNIRIDRIMDIDMIEYVAMVIKYTMRTNITTTDELWLDKTPLADLQFNTMDFTYRK